MALHGPIQINNHSIGHWYAERRVTADDGFNTYWCGVEWTPEGERQATGPISVGRYTNHARRWTGVIFHDYKDGALALAAKILTEATKEGHDGTA